MGLLSDSSRSVGVTPIGERLLTLLRGNSVGETKTIVSELAKKTIPAYSKLLRELGSNDLSSAALEAKLGNPVPKETFFALLALATWCGDIERKLEVKYLVPA